ncbi:protein SGT1 homolog A-like [Vitis riparia]|uniref:protein SGT1 homolog A-like n=1 Tax=Vitis riparia TaxID=96939 RepID=UPI00155A8188|nr:protein SGT1 homolog A-like [Vitis riparia]
MAVELERKAGVAFIDEDYKLAVDLFSKALKIRPNNAELLASRAQANIMLHDYLEAVGDAIKAIQLDPSMAKAYLRKGIACFKLEEYQTAKVALEKGVRFAQNDPRFAKLIKECNDCIAVENASITVGRGASTASAKPKYRHEYYQKPEEVVVTIFAKGIPENNVVVHFAVQTLSVAIEVPGVTPYYLHLRLFGKIIPDNSRYAVMSTKVEIRLAKAEALNWPSLEISDKDQRPTNPSSKAKVIDWDKLQAQIEEEEKEEELKDDATTDADTQRTMNKKT